MKTVKPKKSLRLLTSSPTNSNSRPKKSPASKARKVGKARCAAPCRVPPKSPQRSDPTKISLRREFRALRASLPTRLERDTLITSEWIAETVVQEVERYLNAHLPDNFAERLAARAHYLYPRNKHFHKGLNRPGNGGRETLLMFMRHWTAGWLKRAGSPLYKKLPWSFGNGHLLPVSK